MSTVLIIEDQGAVSKALTVLFEIHGIACLVASTPDEAIRLIGKHEIGVVIQDMNFSLGATSGEEGLALFRSIREADPAMPVLALTAWTSLETAVQMVKEGASDYLAKPWDDAKLLASVRNLLRIRELERENERLRAERSRARGDLAGRYDLCGLLFESDAMHRVASLAVQVASAEVPVLITGAHGVGKEKIAEILHANSHRADKSFVKVNVGALPDDLLESELFGAEAGAYTGSVRKRVGRFGAAHGGTLFLDEIGNLSPAGQMKVLRVLESGEFEPLGSSETIKVDVRVLAATNVDLREAVARGRFREDLFFRLNVIEIAVPALRDRREDILLLAESFLRTYATSSGRPPAVLSRAARAALLEHPWPGNVRELMHAVQRAILVSSGAELSAGDLILGGPGEDAVRAEPIRRAEDGDQDSIEEEAGEKTRIESVLLGAGGSIKEAAARLGVSRQALYRRMERLGIVMERRPKE